MYVPVFFFIATCDHLHLFFSLTSVAVDLHGNSPLVCAVAMVTKLHVDEQLAFPYEKLLGVLDDDGMATDALSGVLNLEKSIIKCCML